MRPTDAYDTFSEYSFPIDRTDVIERDGDRAVESPNDTEKTIAEILDRADIETFASARELTDTFTGNLGEEYIGRKHYDDRGDNVEPPQVAF
jgi:hypothetical protein